MSSSQRAAGRVLPESPLPRSIALLPIELVIPESSRESVRDVRICVHSRHSLNPRWYAWLDSSRTISALALEPSAAGFDPDTGAPRYSAESLVLIVTAWKAFVGDSHYSVETCVARGFFLLKTPAAGHGPNEWSIVRLRDPRGEGAFEIRLRCNRPSMLVVDPQKVATDNVVSAALFAEPSFPEATFRLCAPEDLDATEEDFREIEKKEDANERDTFCGIPADKLVSRFDRTLIWYPVFEHALSPSSSDAHTQEELNEREFKLCPVWAQCLYLETPDEAARFGSAFFSDNYIIHATRCALAISGIKEEQFMGDVLCFPEVLAQVAEFFTGSVSYISDRNVDGKPCDWFSGPTVCRQFQFASADCEDFARDMVHCAQYLYYVGWHTHRRPRENEEDRSSGGGGGPSSKQQWQRKQCSHPLFLAITRLAMAYLPFCCDVTVRKDRRRADDNDDDNGNGDETLLHARSKLVPVPVALEIAKRGLHISTNVTKRNQQIQRDVVDYLESQMQSLRALFGGEEGKTPLAALPVLDLESTDRTLANERSIDPLVREVGGILNDDQWRVALAFRDIYRANGPTIELMLYSAVLGMCAKGAFRFRLVQKAGPSDGDSGGGGNDDISAWKAGLRIPVDEESPTQYMLDNCAMLAMAPPSAGEMRIARLVVASREIPCRLDVDDGVLTSGLPLPRRLPGLTTFVFSSNRHQEAIRRLEGAGMRVQCIELQITNGVNVAVLCAEKT